MERRLKFQTENLPLPNLLALVDCFSAIGEVLSGMQCQPRFDGGDGRLNEAGSIMEDLRVIIGLEVDHIRDVVTKRRVTTKEDACHKFDILLPELVGGENPASAVARLASLVADMDWQIELGGSK